MLVQCTPGGRKYAEVLTVRAPRFDFKMAVFTAEQKTLARQLIGTVTGLQPHEENFKLCFQFVKSNFRYHRFLDVDSFKVSRSIRGLVEKFSVHAQPERAQALEGLTDRFLQCPLQLEKSYPKSDTHYSILLLLLLLSDNPTATQWSHAHPDTPTSRDVGDDFDWAAYLREGIEFASFSDSDSEWSQLSEEEEETEVAKETQADSAVGEDISEEEEEEGTADKLVQVSRSRSWMLEHVVVPYWNQSHPYHHPGLPAPPPSSTHPSCTLSSQWRSHREAVDPLFFPAEVVTVAETNIVRETLWVLLGAERSFVYTVGEGVRREGVRGEGVRGGGEGVGGGGEGVGVRRGVQVSHLTPLALHRQLQQFASVATLLLKLRRFIEAMISNMCNPPSPSPSPSPPPPPPSLSLTQCQTYEAAADGLTYCLQKFDDQLIEVERRIVEKKAFVSLLTLSTELHPAFTQIQLLYNVFSVVLQPPSEDDLSSAPHQCSVRLLDSLWNGMQYYDTLGEAGRITVHQLFPLWVMCVRPYLSMIGRWMVEGYLEDRHGELCVVRSKTVVAKTGDYWNMCYSVVQPVPVFLQPVIHKVMLAGKSVDLIESTGKLRMMEEMVHSQSLDVSSSHPPTSPSSPPPSPTSSYPSTDLYEELLLLLREELLPVPEEGGREGRGGGGGGGGEGGGGGGGEGRRGGGGEGGGGGGGGEGGVEEGEKKGEEGEGEEGEQEKEEEEERDREEGGVRERQEESEQQRETSQGTMEGGGGGQSRADPAALPLELHGMSPLLQQYLLSLSSPHPPIISSSRLLWEELNTIKAFPQHTPITVMIQKCLYPLIVKRYKKSSGCLMHILQSEFHLMDHLRTVQLFLLMEAGDTLHHFCSDIFLRIQHGEPWHDLLYLNSLLQDVLLPHYPHLEKKLTVLLDDQNCSKDLLHSITAISLHYEVPWPLDTVFSQPLMDMYNEVFHLLLQVKWAKWSLEGIQTKEYSSTALPPDQSFRLHQLLLLRSKLLHFVNSLYNYLMTRILHSIGLEYQQKMAQAEDLDAVISLHTEYVTTIFDRCLLNRKASIVKEAILKTLRLALTYRQKWEKGLSHFSHAEAAGVESEFLKCSHFLTTCLNKTVKRGTFPYLETLAFSLNTLKTDQKIFGNQTKTT